MRARQLSAARPSSGFSLLEMLLVMALIAIATLLAMSAFSGGMQGMALRGGAKELAAQFRAAASTATSPLVRYVFEVFVPYPQAEAVIPQP